MSITGQPTEYSARQRLAEMPHVVSRSDWYLAHAIKIHELIVATTRAAMVLPAATSTHPDVEQALNEVLLHAQLIAGKHCPIILATNGDQWVPHAELVVALTKASVLEKEVAHLRNQLAQTATLKQRAKSQGRRL